MIDSGLMRVPVYEPEVGLTRLETVRVSRANADQRRGRAGRTEPGVCYRLMGGGRERRPSALRRAGNPLRRSLRPHARLRSLGRRRSGEARLPRFPAARRAEGSPRASDRDRRHRWRGRITEEGRAIASLALPPRLARMVVDAARAGEGRIASEVAVVLTERGLGGDAVDLATRLEVFRRDRSQRADDAAASRAGWRERVEPSSGLRPPSPRGRRGHLPRRIPGRRTIVLRTRLGTRRAIPSPPGRRWPAQPVG